MVTLEEAKKNVRDALQKGVIDEFAKNSYLLQRLQFDDAVSPVGGGATLTYSYTRLKTQPTADFREVNTEYAEHEVSKEEKSVTLKIFGGAYGADRIIAGMGGIANEVTLQMQQKIKATTALFCDTVINGDSAANAKAFDGLDVALAGSNTEYYAGGVSASLDLSTEDMIDANYKKFLDYLDDFFSTLDGKPDALLMNGKLRAKIRACARRSSMYSATLDSFGKNVDMIDNIPMIDLGAKSGSNDPVVGIDNDGLSGLYAVQFGIDGFHGVSMAGQPMIKTWLPDYSKAGAVKKGEVEMVAAVALKRTKAAGVWRNLKVV